LYKCSPDAVPPIHAVSYHVATAKPPAQDGDKFRSIFNDNLQPIATRGKKARGTLLANQHGGNGCSIKRAPLSVSYYNEISGRHIGRGVVRRRCSAGPVLPQWSRVSLAAELREAAAAYDDHVFWCRRVVVRAAAAVLGVNVDDQMSEEATRSHVTGTTDDRRCRRVVG